MDTQSPTHPIKIGASELAQCTQWLEAIAQDALILSQLSNEDRIRLLVAGAR